MKTKLVLWGTNENDEKVLLGLKLNPKENKVSIFIFPEAVASEEFAKTLLDDWRNGVEVPFPEGYTEVERELSVTDSLLPENLKVERGDIIQRAQTEWHFIVLSSKLNEVYESELSELKEKIDKLTAFDSDIWESLKTFWSKVQRQVRDRNLFREHANTLRDNTNALFARLKELRSALDEEFKTFSKEHFDSFMASLEDIENRIKEENKLQSVFDELKSMQRKFRDTKLTREHRSKIWERLDAAFKSVKEKRFGPNAGDSSPLERLQRRYDGLIAAIQKMEKSIQRDKDDLEFQNKKITTTDGQLEEQILQAKMKMTKVRISSKEEKLGEMMQTKAELDKRMESQKDKELKRAERDRLEAAKNLAKEKIAEQIKEAEQARLKESEKLEKAAESISKKEEEETKKEDTLMEAISNTMGDALEDVVDTAKAVAEVVGEKLGEVVIEIKEKVDEMTEQAISGNDSSENGSDDLKKDQSGDTDQIKADSEEEE